MLDRKTKKLKKELESDLRFYLTYYKEVSGRSEHLARIFDEKIEEIVGRLKEIGN